MTHREFFEMLAKIILVALPLTGLSICLTACPFNKKYMRLAKVGSLLLVEYTK